jgi:acetoin utilization deacetylase AcuC-like enzyme
MSLINFKSSMFYCRLCKQSMGPGNTTGKSNKITFNEFLKARPICTYCKKNRTLKDIFAYADSDTYITPFTFSAVLDGIKVLKVLIDEIHKKRVLYGFALIRPPGHHCNNNPSGFCIGNNAIIASKYAQKCGYDKSLILDIDFHHGNGTAELIKSNRDKNIYMCSIHGFGPNVYPGTGSEKENTNNVYNIPLDISIDPNSRKYITDDYYLNIIESNVNNFIKKVHPNIIIISCGFDGHQDDPLEGFNLTDNAYVRIGQYLKSLQIPLLFITEGGYSVQAISRSICKMVQVFL